ncbi:BLUF domain-containing protein [Variovorax sp. PCZ-1]|uniref:BLUF domain-containing protein n=1 Tax=Variovorax sp. PCZ-1 TaxID=2835533 RepID=UPI001BCD8D31|nr:BLUF domain-containing protein [Variovorax sp. PCZ-1]MBS7809007.1 BLUF domain-containing protein [Variovorax sp. PCZ-1]
MLIQLTYASRISAAFTNTDLAKILAASQRNNARVGVTGALCLANGIFLQQLEGDRAEVNRLYHHILADTRHREPAVLDFAEIPSRRFTTWAMGSLAPLDTNRHIFLKYSRSASFDPYGMSATTLQAFFSELLANGEWIV